MLLPLQRDYAFIDKIYKEFQHLDGIQKFRQMDFMCPNVGYDKLSHTSKYSLPSIIHHL